MIPSRFQVAKVIGIFLILIIAAHWVVPWFLYRVTSPGRHVTSC
ncbi:MAG: hypothetical protein WCF90_03725 [Methanomicrobiales archaeon]